MSRVAYVVAYDIADDERREDIATFLSGYGPRVQLSVFEAELPDTQAAASFRDRLRAMIDPDDDQIRLYRLTPQALAERLVYGARRIEERTDFWIV
jgi:CRISPR-associated endoribonuclease Cas2